VASGRRGAREGAVGGDLVGRNPTDRGKAGVKRSILVDADDGPLAAVAEPVNEFETPGGRSLLRVPG